MEPEGSAVHLPYKNLSIRMQKNVLKQSQILSFNNFIPKIKYIGRTPRHFKCLRQIYMLAKKKYVRKKSLPYLLDAGSGSYGNTS